MKRLLLLTGAGLFVLPAYAGADVLRIDGVRYLNYSEATGEITPGTAETRRIGHPLWSAGYEYVGYVFNRHPELGQGASDWGDVGGPAVVGGFEFSSFTNSTEDDGDLWVIILFYTGDDGFNSVGKVYTAGVVIPNVPGNPGAPDQYWGQVGRVEVEVPFVIDGSDLDGDNLADFGYFMFCSGRTPGCVHGPGVWDRALVDPNDPPSEAPGVEDAVDLYADPDWNAGWINVDPNNLSAAYVGTGPLALAYGQIHMVLFAPGCPNRGDSGRYCQADIDGSIDCIVGLADLAQLLGHYGITTGATLSIGDVDPYDEWFPGDGDVDLSDLAELLSQYGDDCN